MSDVFDKVPAAPQDPGGGSNGAQKLPAPGSGDVVEGGAGRRFILADEENHLCFRCGHLFLKHQIIETAGDTDDVAKEREGFCMIQRADLTNETVTWCTHFEHHGGLLVRLLDLLGFDVRFTDRERGSR